MYIFDENSQPLIVDNLFDPIVTETFWVLDLEQKDFMQTELTMLEETTCPGMVLAVDNFGGIVLPAHWHVLVCDPDTMQLDAVTVGDMAGKEFRVFVYGPQISKPRIEVTRVLNYLPRHRHVSPTLSRHQMLCHAIGQSHWVCVSPSDTYNKFLKSAIIGDLI